MTVASRIRELRKKKGISQRHLAQCLSISAPSYCYKEKGMRSFKVKEIAIIARALDVSPCIFLPNK